MTEDRGVRGGHTGELACGRQPLIDAITRFLEHEHASRLPEIRAILEQAIDDEGPGAIDMLSRRLADAGTDWSFYPRDPLARRIHHALADPVLQQAPLVTGLERLQLAGDRPLVIIANHLSYSDANAIEVMLQKAGRRDICDRLTVIAGPKVYSNVRRRFSSLCFGTIKVPQSSSVSTDEAVMNTRDVARGARRSIEIARERLRLGEVLLVFAEGSRSRTGQMQRLLSGAARYLDLPETLVVPAGITGTESLFPLAEDGLRPVGLSLHFGWPVPVRALEERSLGDRRVMMDCIGFAIAGLLPAEYRGVYAGAPEDDAACPLARELFERGGEERSPTE